MKTAHPMQPVARDSEGTLRFKQNSIVRFLLDQGGGSRRSSSVPGAASLNDLGAMPFPREDWEQFYQLIGYSVSGYAELDNVSDEMKDAAELMALNPEEDPREARIAALEVKLAYVRKKLRKGVAELYGLHPDDLGGGK